MKVSLKVMPFVVYFMLFISQTCENFTELCYITEGASEQEHVLPSVKVALLPLQPHGHSILKCLVIHSLCVLAGCLSKDPRGEHMVVQG
jgi:hypothetical protein